MSMINYRTELPYQSPVSPQQMADAEAAMRASYPGMSQNARDIMAGAGARNVADYRAKQGQANNNYGLDFQANENRLALAGLGNMEDARQNEMNINRSRLDQMTGLALSGLFK